MLSRTAPWLLFLLLAAPSASSAATRVGVGFQPGVYRGAQTVAASALLQFSVADGRLPVGLADLHLELPAGLTPLTRDWVLAALRHQGPQDVAFTWFGPESLPRAGALQHLDREAVVQAAQAALQARVKGYSMDFSLKAVSEPADVALNPGSVTLKPRLPAAGRLRSRMAVEVDVYLDGVQTETVPVWFAVKAARRVAVYAHDMRAEEEVGKDDLRWETRDLAELGSDPVMDPAELAGKWLRRPVTAGEPLVADDLAQAPLVRHHQRVEVQVVSGPVAIVAWGIAEDSGNAGDTVSVRVDKSEGPCKGRVIGMGVVQIEN